MAIINRYGYEWDTALGANDLNIELACYADNVFMKKRSNEHIQFNTEKPAELHMKNAWRILWPDFIWNEWAELQTWAWCNYDIVANIGHAGAGKSFGFARIILLDYMAKPFDTSTTMVTPKFEQLRTHIFGDLIGAKDSSPLKNALESAFKFTSTSNELSVKALGGGDKHIIRGTAADQSDTDASKLRGQHAPRRRMVADECEHIGEVLFTAINNGRLDPDFKAGLLTNPADRSSVYCQDWAAPKNGWGSVSTNDLFWETKQQRGICIHFNAILSPNVKAKKVVVPGLVTEDYIDGIRTQNGGENSLQWWMFVLGFPPPDGIVNKIWPESTIEKARRKEIFDFKPQRVASLDPAFQHDDCVMIFGDMGYLRDGKPCICATQSMKLNVEQGNDRMLKEEQIAFMVMDQCAKHGVEPKNFIMDCTGQGRGLYEILKQKWGYEVQGISYNDKATNRPIRAGGRPADEEVVYFVSELWFRASNLAADNMLCGLADINSRTRDDLSSRLYSMKNVGGGDKMVAESKDDLKKRIGHSPDYGDAYCQFGELMVRRGLVADFHKNNQSSDWGLFKKLALKAQKTYVETWEN